jgi:hypothetical protein
MDKHADADLLFLFSTPMTRPLLLFQMSCCYYWCSAVFLWNAAAAMRKWNVSDPHFIGAHATPTQMQA